MERRWTQVRTVCCRLCASCVPAGDLARACCCRWCAPLEGGLASLHVVRALVAIPAEGAPAKSQPRHPPPPQQVPRPSFPAMPTAIPPPPSHAAAPFALLLHKPVGYVVTSPEDRNILDLKVYDLLPPRCMLGWVGGVCAHMHVCMRACVCEGDGWWEGAVGPRPAFRPLLMGWWEGGCLNACACGWCMWVVGGHCGGAAARLSSAPCSPSSCWLLPSSQSSTAARRLKRPPDVGALLPKPSLDVVAELKLCLPAPALLSGRPVIDRCTASQAPI